MVVYFNRRPWKRSNKQRAGESLGPVARNWSRTFKMHREAEAHRNYRESVSRISRALARHVRGPRRLSDYLNAAICMRRRSGKRRVHAWPTSYDRSDPSRPANGESGFPGRRWLFNSSVLDTSAWLDCFNYESRGSREPNKFRMRVLTVDLLSTRSNDEIFNLPSHWLSHWLILYYSLKHVRNKILATATFIARFVLNCRNGKKRYCANFTRNLNINQKI